MADLSALEAYDREIRAAECVAITSLAEHLRELIRELPSESRLPLVLLAHAKQMDSWAYGANEAACGGAMDMTHWVDGTLEHLLDELREDEEGDA
jgi:hypothetical protein